MAAVFAASAGEAAAVGATFSSCAGAGTGAGAAGAETGDATFLGAAAFFAGAIFLAAGDGASFLITGAGLLVATLSVLGRIQEDLEGVTFLFT